jgi:hypothetical protein
MTIPNNWYISDCTSEVYPTSKMDAGTFYLPNNIQYNEEDKIYYYQEYRFTMPIDYEVPAEVSDTLAEQLDIYSKQFGKRIYELENSQVEQDKKASEIDMAILGLMDTILTMQTQP